MESFDRLYSIILKLRGENGCPWDREQTTESMVSNLIEETYEVVEAIEKGNHEDLEEELGDLMFLALFIGIIAEQEGKIIVEKMISGVADKLVRRHPHVFGALDEKNVDRIIQNWESIKMKEKKNTHRKTPFDGIPKSLPEIQRYNKIIDKSKRAGYRIEKAEKKTLKGTLNRYLKSSKDSDLTGFIQTFLNYMYHKKIDLPKKIRSIADRHISDFTGQSITKKTKNIK